MRVDHLFGYRRGQITAKQLLTFQIVNACAIAGDQPGRQGELFTYHLHIHQMAARGKGNGDIALMQGMQGVDGFIPNRCVGSNNVPSISNAARRAMQCLLSE